MKQLNYVDIGDEYILYNMGVRVVLGSLMVTLVT